MSKEQTDGGASAHDRKSRRKLHAEQSAAPWPGGCRTCDRTGRREVAEHWRDGSAVVVHLVACDCLLGVARAERQKVPRLVDVTQAIESRFRLAIEDPSPRQRVPGGATAIAIPALGAYVPRTLRAGSPDHEATTKRAEWAHRCAMFRAGTPLPPVDPPAPPRLDAPAPTPEPEPSPWSAPDEPAPWSAPDEPPPWSEAPDPSDDQRPPIDDDAQPWR